MRQKDRLPRFEVILKEVKLKGFSEFSIKNSQAKRALVEKKTKYEKFAQRLVKALDYWGLKLARHPFDFGDRRVFRVTRKVK